VAVKMVFCLRRLPALSAEEFSRYWREEHAELFRRYAATLGVRRYTQSHCVPGRMNDALRQHRGGPEAFDGVAEVWYDDLATLLAAISSDEGRAAGEALIKDELQFIDHAASPIFITDEVEIDLPSGG